MSQSAPLPSTTSASAQSWAVAELRAPTFARLRAAKQAGIDPNALLDRFREQFHAACLKDAETIWAIADGDQARERGLWDEVNAIAVARRHEWHELPAVHVARLDGATPSDLAQLADGLRRSMTVGHRVVRARRSRGACTAAPTSRLAARARGAGRPRVRVARRIASAASSSPDDGPGSSPPPIAGRLPSVAHGQQIHGASSRGDALRRGRTLLAGGPR